ncbi:MAG: AbrB/MazE/SpoVT family DNA-binding domain-containing protein [Candidatus Saccharibacteria bacterium]|nr:AbrB/MazE/SpoVT family DNA-binding domain-containing protein [Candidatus Saccharibacteria bacterium]
MVIKSIQKVIKVGDSLAVTIPAKDARIANLKPGASVSISLKEVEAVVEPDTKSTIDAEYQLFKKQYGATLKNLANR